MDYLFVFSLVFEILALVLALVFKENKIFFMILAILGFRLIYLYTSLYQAHLFVSLFLPFVYFNFVFLNTKAIFDKININKISILIIIAIIALVFSKDTDFNFILNQNNKMIYILNLVEFFVLLGYSIYKKNIHFLVAFILLIIPFYFNNSSIFFELASFYFTLIIIYNKYKKIFKKDI